MALRSLSLCAGIGGIDLGLAPWARTVCYVEREAFAASVLVARMEDAALDQAPIWSDLRTFDARAWRGAVDLVTGGYPCQPFSVAGKRLGEHDERHLWPDVRRVLDESGAALGFFENVAGHVSLGLADVLADLAALGFDAEWTCNSASDFGDSMEGERLFILASANGVRKLQSRRLLTDIWRRTCNGREEVGASGGQGLERRNGPERAWSPLGQPWPPGPQDGDGWSRWIARGGPQPVLRRGVDGAPAFLDWADRIRSLGNAVVPAQARAAFAHLAGRVLA